DRTTSVVQIAAHPPQVSVAMTLLIGLLAMLARLLLPAGPAGPASPSAILPNGNQHAAGVLNDGILRVSLETRTGMWYPEGPNGQSLEVADWAEPGQPLQNPGPLIAVPAGTLVQATLRNTLGRPYRAPTTWPTRPRRTVRFSPRGGQPTQRRHRRQSGGGGAGQVKPCSCART
ncbi:MAG: hypothetical protein ACRELE_05550, partial [Gemmatimonadales bacterium]